MDRAEDDPLRLTRETKRDKPANVPRAPKTNTKAAASPKKRRSKAEGDEQPETEASGAARDDDDDGASDESEPAGVDDELASTPAAVDEDEEAEAKSETFDDSKDDADLGAASAPLSKPMSGTSLERLDPMAAYLREVQRHPLLTPAVSYTHLTLPTN